MNLSNTPTSRNQLRQWLRQQRRSLGPVQQRRASAALRKQLGRQLFFLKAASIAAYVAHDGEIDARPSLDLALSLNKKIFLPRLSSRRNGHLDFLAWHPRKNTLSNRFGILEPTHEHTAPLWTMDVVLVPLVGFDRHGHRLGMGGGYYDKSLASLPRRPRRPRLWGLAHDCQEVEHLPSQWWDWPLDAIITPSRFLKTR